ncbi:MAG: hypothetical protein IPK60_10325 [Sandaracinaceae bacterium]|nr:hypothetical protein [Sandaracinaceae bacterium]
MNRIFLFLAFPAALVGCGSSVPGVPAACGEDYVRATIAFPGHDPREYCIADAFFQNRIHHDGPFCETGSGAVSEGSVDVVRMDIFAPGPWFTRVGVTPMTAFLFGATEGQDIPDDFCGASESRCIYQNTNSCSFAITRAARADGEIVEGRLTAPCDLNGGEHFGEPVFPTVTAADFRARLVSVVDNSPDAGMPCMFYPDLGPL